MAKSIEVTLELNNKQYSRALNQSKTQTDSFGKSAKVSMAGVASAFAALGGAAVIKSIVDVGQRFQDLRTSLAFVEGSAEAGATAFKNISALATTTQFGVEELAKSYIRLQSEGLEPTNELLLSFAGAASITQDQLGSLTALTELFARAAGKGKLELTDFDKIAERGIPIYSLLQEKFGMTVDQIKKLATTAKGQKQLFKGIQEALEDTYGEALPAKLKDSSIAFSNLNIAVNNLKDSLFTEMGLDATAGIESLTAAIQSLADNTEGLGRGLAAAAGVLETLAAAFVFSKVVSKNALDQFVKFGDKIKGLFAKGGVFAGAIKIFKDFAFSIRLAGSTIAGFVGKRVGLGALAVALAAVAPAGAGVAILIGSIGLAIDGLARIFTGKGIIQHLKDFAYYVGILTKDADESTESIKNNAHVLAHEAEQARLAGIESKKLADRIKELSSAAKGFTETDYRTELEKLTDRQQEARRALGDLLVAYEMSNGALADYEKLLAAVNNEIVAADKAVSDYKQSQQDATFQLQSYVEFMKQLKEETASTINQQRHATDALKFFTQAYEDGFISAEAFAIMQERLNSILGITKDEADEVATGMETYKDALAEAGSALTDYTLLQELLNELFTTGQITLTEYNDAIRDLDEQFSQNEGLNNFLDVLGSAQVALSQDLAQAFMDGESAGDSFQKFFKKMVKQIIADILRLQIIQPILSSIMAPFGFGFGSGGSVVKLPSGDGGGYTGSGARAGGVDGRGGFPAILHPNETVIDHTKGQGMGAVQNTAVTYNINAVDARSFKELVASDPEYLYNVTQVGARRQPR
jgi:hypothetical protein